MTTIHFTASEYGWTVEHTLDCPLVILMLLMRQKLYSEKHNGMTLLDKEMIGKDAEGKTWEELVQENRKMLAALLRRQK